MAVLHHGRTEPPDTEACPEQSASARRDQSPTARREQSLTARPEPYAVVLPEQSLTARPQPYATAHPKQPRATVPEQSSADLPQRPPAALPGAPPARRPLKRPLVLALLLAAALLSVVHQIRPVPYGDRLTPGPPAHTARARGDVVEAYDGRTLRWRYARVGRRPLSVLPARGHTFTVWDDGLVTDTDGRSVRWHRALPAATGWLRTRGGAGVLRPLGRSILAIVTPARIAAYRTADGDLRWVLPARAGCAFRPERAVRHGPALLVAQPCAHGAWTAQLVAVDDLGGIAPHRTPLGNERPGVGRPEHPRTEKALAPPR
ncbi:hypothetical protein [Streptomyces sp. GbtcB6]|uniref:hypothetical protein n=1 Tax=Streptomyces sp. GbtcB6 TaxID=2824751 RepID=UPI0027E55E40|nr:hypothetical protein [Streptomyces sp. GbtcB6]